MQKKVNSWFIQNYGEYTYSLDILFLQESEKSFRSCALYLPSVMSHSREREYSRFVDTHGQKEVRGSTIAAEVLLVNYTLAMEIGVLVPDLLVQACNIGI